jgi:sn-glycerol 3-phosphate transport system substrate-binding protein
MRHRHRYQLVTGLTVLWLALGLALSVTDAFAQTKPIKLRLWHAMSGARLEAIIKVIAEGFGAAHPGIAIEPLYTGSYAETLTKAIAAFRAGNPPHIVQVYEVGTQTMVDSGAIVPVTDLIKAGVVDWGDYIAPILNYYTVQGKLFSMPFNSSTAVLYYNRDAFKKAGLDANHPPGTFAEVEEMGHGEAVAASGALSYHRAPSPK